VTRRPRHHVRRMPRLQGLDTEACHGDLLVVCSPKRHQEYHNKPQRLLDWLWENSREMNLLYNLAYDRDVLIKPLLGRLSRLDRRGLREDHEVTRGAYRISLLGNKSFSIRRGVEEHAKRFFDVSPFFADGERSLSLDEVARAYLGEAKTDKEEGIDRVKLGKDRRYYRDHRAAVIRYCRQDAALTLRLGRLLLESLGRTLGYYPSRLNSKASISKAWIEVNHPELITYRKVRRYDPHRAAYKGGIFHTRILGRVEHVNEIDITSAYGDALRKIPRLDALTRRVSKQYHPGAVLGSYLISIVYDGRLPFPRGKNRRVAYPVSNGKLRPYRATKPELEHFIEKGYDLQIYSADEFFYEGPGPVPLQFPEIEELLDWCAALKEPAKTDTRARIERMLWKTMINAIYGCLAESKHGETPLTHWPLAADITARTRVAIWKEWDRIEAEGGHVISINTDSIRYVGPLLRPLGPAPVGEFEIKFADATVTHYQSGIALIEHSTGKVEMRKRGMPKLTAEMLLKARGNRLEVPNTRTTHLFEGLAQGREADIGNIDDDSEKTIDLLSNLFALKFGRKWLTFEYLNNHALRGYPPDFDDITGGEWDAQARALRKLAKRDPRPERARARARRLR
jgi:hypothetical protein